MTDDLFPKSMRDRVIDFARRKYLFTSCDLEDYKQTLGHIPGYLRIHREARQLAEDGVLKRLTVDEKLMRNFKDTRIAVYEWRGR